MDTSFATYSQAIEGTGVSFTMVAVKGGTFRMGSDAKPDEGPSVSVSVPSFWMEEHEVTYEEYVLFQDEQLDKAPKPDGITRPSPPYIDFTLGMGKTGGFPANSMSLYAAISYCRWLYKKTGIFYRLPTEAEWEYACTSGEGSNTMTPLADYAWYAENSGNKYHAVKGLKPNRLGLYDMLGNVAEWTIDQYNENYHEQIQEHANNPWLKPAKKHPFTLRGGTFKDNKAAISCTARIASDLKWNARDPQIPKSKWWNADAPFIGFRIVRPQQQPSSEEIEQFYSSILSLK